MSNDPVKVCEAAAEALVRGDWEAAASLCDSVSLEIFKRRMIEQHTPRPPVGDMTAEELMRHSPDMPRAVAEYQVEQLLERSKLSRRMDRDLPGFTDISSLQAAPAEAVFAAWLHGSSLQHQVRLAVEDGQVPARALVEWENHPVPQPKHIALGAVPGREGFAYVVFRTEYPATEADTTAEEVGLPPITTWSEEEQAVASQLGDRPAVVICRQQPNGDWRLLADSEFFGPRGSFGFFFEPAE